MRAGCIAQACREMAAASVRGVERRPRIVERPPERRAPPDRALGPDATAVAAHHARTGGQPDAGPGELGRAVQALERREQAAGIRHVEAGAVVAHVEAALAVLV